MLKTCEMCSNDFLTESDPYVVVPRPIGAKYYCYCMIAEGNELSKINKLIVENKKLREALKEIRNMDWGTDHCDAKNMIADKVLDEYRNK